MANIYISEFANLARQSGAQVGSCPPVAEQKVAYTTSTASAAFATRTTFVRLLADADAHVKFAASPTATAANMLLKADVDYFFGVIAGQKVAAYDGTT